MKKYFYILAMTFAVIATSLGFTSCEDDEDGAFLSGKEFTATAHDSGIDKWVLRFGSGSLSVRAYDYNGKEISSKRFTGDYQIDFNNSRIFISWNGYSANTVWYYRIDESLSEEWPYYDPAPVITAPSGSGALGGLTFYPGNYLKAPGNGR